jgi:L-alanine-DL-glutamate epimerase-like enolase superfamily enzyme
MVAITGVRTFPYNYTMTRKIGDVHLPDGTDAGSDMAVMIDTDEGVTGVTVAYGQGTAEITQFAPLLLGEDPRSVRALWQRMKGLTFKMGNAGSVKIAVSALDAALWDLRAKLNGVPLWKELGADRGSAAAYASGLDTPLHDDELAAFYLGMASLGFNAGKLKVGLDQETDLRRLRIMRDALATSGKTPVLMIDANEYWTAKQSIRRIREMEEEFDLAWAEEPAGRRDAVGLRKVSEAIDAAVATGENLDNSGDFANLIREKAVDVVQIGVLTAGITGALQVAEMAYSYGLPVAMMNCPGRHMAHLAAALPHHLMMEVLDCGRDQMFTHSASLTDGRISLGDEPGSGIVFDEEQLEAQRAEAPSPRSLRSIYRRSPSTWIDEHRSS